jgi:hypothetical protein
MGPSAAERLRSLAEPAAMTQYLEKAVMPARSNTDHGLAWDGPGPVPRVSGLEAAKLRPKRGIFRKGVGRPANHDAGSGSRTHPKETMMRFYNQPHRFYCGVDLHARTMYLCILDDQGRAEV